MIVNLWTVDILRNVSQQQILRVYVCVARGVQYVNCVMHKCIMVKVGGSEIHIKYVKSR